MQVEGLFITFNIFWQIEQTCIQGRGKGVGEGDRTPLLPDPNKFVLPIKENMPF